MFWILAALLTALVSVPVIWPLMQRRASRPVAGGHDVEVYAAQLSELDSEVQRGLIAPEEAGVARAEIGRRLLRAASEGTRPSSGPSTDRRASVMVALVLAFGLPASALALYAQTGAPNQADLPLAARQGGAPNVSPSQGGDLQSMVAAAEARLAENPQDGRGWDVLAPIYARLGDLPRAQTAYRNALALLGESAPRLTGYGEVQVRVSSGEVSEQARQAFQRANELDPELIAPRVFLALRLTQDGRPQEAASAWTSLLATAPADAPWRPMAEAALAQTQGRAPAPGSPTQAQIVERAAALPEGGEAQMIEGMVAGLASRLEADPNDAQGWARLVHAYGVLGDEAAGQAALSRARQTFPAGTEEWARISNAAATAGLVVSSETRP